MNKFLTASVILPAVALILSGASLLADHSPTPKAMDRYGALPLSFEANAGQADPEVKFLARGPGYTAFLGAEAVLLFTKPGTQAATVVRMKLVGANPKADVTGLGKFAGKVNYFRGSSPDHWQRDISTFARVKYQDVYPGVDLIYYGNQRQLEHDFVLAPGADPDRIVLQMEGVESLDVTADGDLKMHLADGEVRLRKPFCYQEEAGKRRVVSAEYVLKGDRQVKFRIGAYDPSAPLIIDPVLDYSTYLGGSLGDDGMGIAVDTNGNAYVTGTTSSMDFPALNPLQSGMGGGIDVFVTKLNATGSALIYSTYLGGSGTDLGAGIKVDDGGNVYVAGSTDSTNFPVTVGAFDTTPNGLYDAFVAKLNSDGSALVYCTLLGGTGNDSGQALALNDNGNVHLTGHTGSNVIPLPTTPGAFQTTRHVSNDVYVAKMNLTGSALVYSTFLGGDRADIAYGIAVDADGAAYVTGSTTSTNFPTTPGAFNTLHQSHTDAFVTKLNSAGSALVYSTLLGGSSGVLGTGLVDQYDNDIAYGIAVDAHGEAYVTGYTQSTNFPTTVGALNSTPPFDLGHDTFITKLNSAGSDLVYSTFLGSHGTTGRGIAVDPAGAAYVTGDTYSPFFPTTPGAFDTSRYGHNAFMLKLNTNGSALLYSTYLGGFDGEFGRGIAVDGVGKVYVVGTTVSSNYPVSQAALQLSSHGAGDAFVTKVNPVLGPVIVSSPVLIPSSAVVNQPCTFSIVATNPAGGVLEYTWDFGDGTGSSGNPASHSYTSLGSYTVTVSVANANISLEETVTVVVRPPNTTSGSLRFKESYSSRPRNGFPIFSGVVSGRFKVVATASLQGFDITQFNADTPFRIGVGDFEFAGKLGDDPNYLPGATKAQFVVLKDIGSPSKPRSFKALTISLKWNSQSLSVKAGLARPRLGISQIAIHQLEGQPNGTVQKTAPTSLELAGANVTFDLPYTAILATDMDVFTPTPPIFTYPRSNVSVVGAGSGVVGQ